MKFIQLTEGNGTTLYLDATKILVVRGTPSRYGFLTNSKIITSITDENANAVTYVVKEKPEEVYEMMKEVLKEDGEESKNKEDKLEENETAEK